MAQDGTDAAATTVAAQPTIVMPSPYPRSYPDVSKIETFANENFKRWQERVFSLLNMHGVVYAITDPKPETDAEAKVHDEWLNANKVCRHVILQTLSNELFDVYFSYKEAKPIWEALTKKFTAEDATKQKFVVSKFYHWQMVEDKEMKSQINEYQKLVEDLKAEEIVLPENFIAGTLIEKFPDSWSDYKNNLKHKHKLLSLDELVTHILIEERKRKEGKIDKAREFAQKANWAQGDVIVAVVFQANMIASVKEWVVDSGATRHICANREAFSSYEMVGNVDEVIYLGDSRTAKVFGKGKVVLKLTSGKTLALNNVLHVPDIRANLISVSLLGKVGVKVSFESDKIVMTKNNVFVGKGYCNQGLFVLNVSSVIDEN